MQVVADYHTHTHYSDGVGSIRANIEAGIEQGLEEVAIADHGPASRTWKQLGVSSPETLLEIKRKVDKYNRLYSAIEVLSAVEANIVSRDGQLDVPQNILQELDKVLVGFHLFIRPLNWRAGKEIIVDNLLLERMGINRQKIRRRNTELIRKVLRRYDVDIITHPGFQVNIDTPALAQAAREQQTAVEINAKHAAELVDFGAVAEEEGVKFCLGSDAHRPEQVGEVGPALRAAEIAGLSAEEIINVRR